MKECYAIDEEEGDGDMMSSSLNSIAGIYVAANQPEEAEKYALQALELSRKSNNPVRLSIILGMAAEIEQGLEKYDEALKYVDEALQIEEKIGGQKRMVRLSQKAAILNALDRGADAEKILVEVIPALQKENNRISLCISYNNMGQALLKQDRHVEAGEWYRKGALLAEELNNPFNEMHALRGLYQALWEKNPELAKRASERYNNLRDSLYTHASAETLARFNAEFKNEELKNENNTLRMRNGRNLKIAVIVIILLFIGLIILFRLNQCHRARMNKRLNEVIAELERTQLGHEEQAETDEEDGVLSASDLEFLNRVGRVITDEMGKGSLSVEKLSDILCMSGGNLNRRIKSITGVTTKQYILRLQLEHSRDLLLGDAQMAIQDVALKSGFEDANNFSRAFKRLYGVSPTDFRNNRK